MGVIGISGIGSYISRRRYKNRHPHSHFIPFQNRDMRKGKAPCLPEAEMNRGPWTALEDKILMDHVAAHGEGGWVRIPTVSGLKRSGKSCRLRWRNYLRSDIKFPALQKFVVWATSPQRRIEETRKVDGQFGSPL